MARLRFQIQGELGNITLAGFMRQLDDHLRMLRDYDLAISREKKASVEWLITNVSTGSLVVETEPRSLLADRNFGPEVAKVYVNGWARIEHEGMSPAYLTEPGMKAARRIVRRIGKDGIEGIVVAGPEQSVTISPKASAHMDQLISVKYRSLGSAEGTLETISIHGGSRFTIYHSRTKKAIRCDIPATESTLLDHAKEALGRRVYASGRLERNARGEPIRIKAERIRILRERQELPTIAELGGKYPDFTGGLTSEEYVRRMRDG